MSRRKPVRSKKKTPKQGFSIKHGKNPKSKQAPQPIKESHSVAVVWPKIETKLEKKDWRAVKYPIFAERRRTDKYNTQLKKSVSQFINFRHLKEPIHFHDAMWKSIEKNLLRSNKDLDIFEYAERSKKTILESI